MAGGSAFNCGITIEQKLFCWGQVNGQVEGLYRQVTVSHFFGCGILADGRINCWGHSPLVARVMGANNRTYVQISCSQNHCCALDDDAHAHCWGSMSVGETAVPLADSRPLEDQDQDEEDEDETLGLEPTHLQFKQISAGPQYSCGITVRGDLQCWGHPSLMKGKYPSRLPGPFKQVSVGGNGVCVLRAEDASEGANAMECWGNAAVVVSAEARRAREWDQVSVGDGIVCGVSMDSELSCWGRSRVRDIPPSLIVA